MADEIKRVWSAENEGFSVAVCLLLLLATVLLLACANDILAAVECDFAFCFWNDFDVVVELPLRLLFVVEAKRGTERVTRPGVKG